MVTTIGILQALVTTLALQNELAPNAYVYLMK